MDSYIVRQAIVDENQSSMGYEILYTEKQVDNEQSGDASAANAIDVFLSSMDGNKFLDGKIAFLTFTKNHLVKKIRLL